MGNRKAAQHVSLEEAQGLGPPPDGSLSVPVLSHGTMEARLYSPVEVDLQKPHDRDEIYVIAQGEAGFFDGDKVVPVRPGSFVFVPAGTPHYFQDLSEGFTVWVFFYGPKGGEESF